MVDEKVELLRVMYCWMRRYSRVRVESPCVMWRHPVLCGVTLCYVAKSCVSPRGICNLSLGMRER